MNTSLWPVLVVSVAVIINCAKEPTGPGPKAVHTENDRVLIVDDTGKSWDITYANQNYGMNPNQFQYGLGPYAIRPLNNPRFLSPGEPGYPKNTDTFVVLGVSINGESRAYPMSVMGRREVVNDQFGDLAVAVTN